MDIYIQVHLHCVPADYLTSAEVEVTMKAKQLP